jgi:hypothetical protein
VTAFGLHATFCVADTLRLGWSFRMSRACGRRRRAEVRDHIACESPYAPCTRPERWCGPAHLNANGEPPRGKDDSARRTPKVTVLTLTYNRRHTLARVFDSLCSQTYGDFEWLVIDDVSDDGTAATVESTPARALYLLTAPAGVALYVRDRWNMLEWGGLSRSGGTRR